MNLLNGQSSLRAPRAVAYRTWARRPALPTTASVVCAISRAAARQKGAAVLIIAVGGLYLTAAPFWRAAAREIAHTTEAVVGDAGRLAVR